MLLLLTDKHNKIAFAFALLSVNGTQYCVLALFDMSVYRFWIFQNCMLQRETASALMNPGSLRCVDVQTVWRCVTLSRACLSMSASPCSSSARSSASSATCCSVWIFLLTESMDVNAAMLQGIHLRLPGVNQVRGGSQRMTLPVRITK